MKTSAQSIPQKSSTPAVSYKPTAAVSSESDQAYADTQGDFDRREQDRESRSAANIPAAPAAGTAGDDAGDAESGAGEGPFRGPQFALGSYSLAGPGGRIGARTGGSSLPERERKFFGPRMGRDFGDVRIHDGPAGAAAAESVNGRALTRGKDIAFAPGEFRPGSTAGRKLLAHELTQVVQQDRGGAGGAAKTGQNPASQTESQNDPESDGKSGLTGDVDLVETEAPAKLATADTENGDDGGPDGDGGDETGETGPEVATGIESGAPGPGRFDGAADGEPPPSAPAGSGSTEARVPIIAGGPGQILGQLSVVPATQAADAFNHAVGASGAALKQQRDQEQRAMPRVVPSTGMASGPQPVRPNVVLQPAAPPDQFRGQRSGRGRPPLNTNTTLPGGNDVTTRLPVDARVDTGGDADPGQMDAANRDANQRARAQTQNAQAKTFLDFGESRIQPAAREPDPCEAKPLSESRPGNVPGAPVRSLAPVMQEPLDRSLTPPLNRKIRARSQEYAAEEEKFQEQKQAARADSERKIEGARHDQTRKQIDLKAQSKKETEKFKAEWRAENAKVQTEFDIRAGRASADQKNKIRAEQSRSETKAREHVRKAEKDAGEKKRIADRSAEAKSREPRERGVFSWLADQAKAFLDGIRNAINAIYNTLRSAVKFIFDAAKQLIKGVLEAARFVIVGLIKTFALLLKTYLRVLLFAFPGICKKFTDLIDQAVQFAVRAVNAVVDFLKKVLCGILDFLSETIDTLLGLIQNIYNGLLTLIALIVTGEIQAIIDGLANLYAAATKSPSFFQQALTEELLGGNLSDPLSPAEVAWAYQNKVPGLPAAAAQTDGASAEQNNDGDTAGGSGGAEVQSDAEGGPQPPFNDKNVLVEPVLEDETLHPELMQEIVQRMGGEDGTFEFGESDDPSHSIAAILNENRAEQNSAENAPAPTNDQEKHPDDGLTPMLRGKVRWEMMKDSLATWWNDNWPWILAAAVGVFAVGVAAIILTGGAILAILPPLLAALTPIFVGMTIAAIAKPLANFVKLAWGGEIDGGAHQLAKAGAAGTIEVVTWLTFKTGALAVRATKATVKGAIRAARTSLRLARLASRSTRAFVRGAKVVMRGLQKDALRGVKRLQALGRLLARRLRFRKFRIRIQGPRFRIEGFINPWVLITEGPIDTSVGPRDKRLQLAAKPPRPGDILIDSGGRIFVYLDDSLQVTDDVVARFNNITTNNPKIFRDRNIPQSQLEEVGRLLRQKKTPPNVRSTGQNSVDESRPVSKTNPDSPEARTVVRKGALHKSRRVRSDKLAEDRRLGIKDFTDQQRMEARVIVKGGDLIFAHSGARVNTVVNNVGQSAINGANQARIVMDDVGNMYIVHARVGVTHSAILAQQPATFAGMIEVRHGKVWYFNRNSGHYAPTAWDGRTFYEHLKKSGADLSTLDEVAPNIKLKGPTLDQ